MERSLLLFASNFYRRFVSPLEEISVFENSIVTLSIRRKLFLSSIFPSNTKCVFVQRNIDRVLVSGKYQKGDIDSTGETRLTLRLNSTFDTLNGRAGRISMKFSTSIGQFLSIYRRKHVWREFNHNSEYFSIFWFNFFFFSNVVAIIWSCETMEEKDDRWFFREMINLSWIFSQNHRTYEILFVTTDAKC